MPSWLRRLRDTHTWFGAAEVIFPQTEYHFGPKCTSHLILTLQLHVLIFMNTIMLEVCVITTWWDFFEHIQGLLPLLKATGTGLQVALACEGLPGS